MLKWGRRKKRMRVKKKKKKYCTKKRKWRKKINELSKWKRSVNYLLMEKLKKKSDGIQNDVFFLFFIWKFRYKSGRKRIGGGRDYRDWTKWEVCQNNPWKERKFIVFFFKKNNN